ncbi:VOC family protein [Pelomonas sp. KK5]|uniref:VOC family protein n=1 Tax=Pelomonas sp. KK5 TaxID=1855730 RepID=UPI00097C7822|nr:VOC family protein [Pelomonas sp. KK5]
MFQSFGLQHIGLTVPDMRQAVSFFERFFGGVVVLSTGALDVDATFMQRKLGVPGDRRISDIQVMRCGNGTNLELFEYENEAVTPIKRNSEIGGFHLAFQVDDCFAAAAQLREAGIEVMDGPTHIDEGPMAGLDWVYFKTPWGQFMELVSLGRLGYEDTSPVRAWSPLD